jgi:hypothetical protein
MLQFIEIKKKFLASILPGKIFGKGMGTNINPIARDAK